MARKRKTTSSRQKNGFRPFRAMVLVFAILGGTFSLLAHIATPAVDRADSGFAAASESDIGMHIPEMERRKKREAGYIGAKALQLHAARIRGSIEEPEFTMGPIEIGMRYEQFQNLSPAPESVKAAQTGVIGVLRTDKGVFTVYFPRAEKESQAFRLSYTQTFRYHSEREITEHLGNLWGKPSTSECGRITYGNGEDCRYQWWPVNGVRVTAQLRTTNERLHGRPQTVLRVDAVDERSEGRRWAGYRVAQTAGR
jgi:hypothetical protein